ncbi:hypothetical protein D3C72_2515000 [compost metagenome]
MSGWAFSFMEAKVGMVSPVTSVTVQPYPFSRMNLSTCAATPADAQFISAMLTSPHSAACAEPARA